MAAGNIIIPNKAKLNLVNATGLLAANAANFRLALCTSALTPNDGDAGNEVWADVSANEIANGNGYTTGGLALTSVALSMTAGVVKFTSAAAVWTASGGSIPAWRYAYIYWLGTLNGKVNPILGHFLGDATPADVPAVAAPNTITVTPAAGGLVSAT
jgi:hypothetical protein